MKKLMHTGKLLMIVAVSALLLNAPVLAQDKAADLPSASSIIDDYIKATGGRAAYEKHTSVKMTGSFAMPAMGITAPLTTYQLAPNLGYTLIESQAFGTIESGSDGQVQWEKTMMTGAKVKEGEEKAVADRQGTFNMMLRWKDFYDSAETVGIEDVDGQPCYKVIMTPKVGQPETSWFAVDSHLLVKSHMTMNSDMGAVTMDAYLSDYREVDGVMVPFHTKQVLMGMQEMSITTETLEWDVEIPAGTFDLPEDVKALVK